LCGQVSRNSVNHTQLEFGYECESVHGLVASIELASDSIELLSFRWSYSPEELFILLRPTMTPARC
jgi:hypothetical protein